MSSFIVVNIYEKWVNCKMSQIEQIELLENVFGCLQYIWVVDEVWEVVFQSRVFQFLFEIGGLVEEYDN